MTGLRGAIILERQIPHIFLGLGSERQRLAIVLTISGFYPGENVVCNDITGIMSKLWARAFEVREVVQNVVQKLQKAFWQVFAECVTLFGSGENRHAQVGEK